MVQSRNTRWGIELARLAVAVATLIAVPALATVTEKEGGGKGEHGSPATSGPSSRPSETSSPTTNEAGVEGGGVERSFGSGPAFSLESRFSFDAGWELHGMLVQNNLVGNGAETVFNYFYAGAAYYFTPNDKLRILAALYQFALADPGESGWRADDILVRYNHHFTLPWKLGLDLAGSLIAPTSFASYKMGVVTVPELRVQLERTFFKHLTVDLRLFGAYYWETYTTVQGGSTPNPIAQVGGMLSAEAELPQHPALALGVDLYSAYIVSYNVAGQPGSVPGVPSNLGSPGSYYGVETNPTFAGQPLQQEYGIDVYVRYDLPKFHDVKPTLALAYANGELTAGYNNDLIDGVSNVYLFHPESSQLYFSLTLKY